MKCLVYCGPYKACLSFHGGKLWVSEEILIFSMSSPHERVRGSWCEGYATVMHLKMKLIRTFSLEVLKQEEYSCVYLCLRAEPAPPWWEGVILFAGLGGGQQAQGWSDETCMMAELHWVPLGFTVTHLWIWGKNELSISFHLLVPWIDSFSLYTLGLCCFDWLKKAGES